MKQKLKAVLHRRRRSSSTQSPRASYEQPDDTNPRAEPHPTLPHQQHRPTSSSSPKPSPWASHTQPSKTTHQGSAVTRSPAPLPDSSADSQPNNADPNGSIADDYRSYLPVLAPGREPIGSAVTTKDNFTEGVHAHNVESQNKHAPHDMAVEPLGIGSKKEYAGMEGGHDWKLKQGSMLKGVVNLRNTVDTDRETTWAPAVTHEVIKPHEHDVIQPQIHREIHNYTYYHRLQPVMQTEVLPPRHFIPNPDGEGLIEISADELPARTGKNRWWDIVQKEPVLPETPFEWRTEPQIIQGKPYMTEEGFERRETTIIYPPTLEDMSNYRGMVQPVHIDHKTGRRWLGDITTVKKLRKEAADTSDEDFMAMKEVTADLPEVASSPSVKRKPVGRDSM